MAGLDPIPDPIVRGATRETDSVSYHRMSARSHPPSGKERVAVWERICRADPANADDKIDLANAYFDVGRHEDAIATLEVAMEQEPKGARFRVARAQLAMRMNDAWGALRYAQEASALDESSTTALGVQSLALSALGRGGEAITAGLTDAD